MFWIYKLLSPIDDENIYSITQSYLNPYSKNTSAAKANQPRMFGRERISCALFVRLESDGRGT